MGSAYVPYAEPHAAPYDTAAAADSDHRERIPFGAGAVLSTDQFQDDDLLR
jgi:hypothetical protein